MTMRLIRQSSAYFPRLRVLVAVTLLTGSATAVQFAAAQSAMQANVQIDNQSQLPNIGEPADRYMSPAREIRIGSDFLRTVYQSGAVLQDPEVSSYIQHLGSTLVNYADEQPFEFTFFLVRNNDVNAFAVPGGFIGVHAGLIETSSNENELAGVLAHEITHVAQRHLARRIADMSNNQFLPLGAMLAGVLLAGAGGGGDASTAMIYSGVALQQQQMINFTRNNEVEADRLGLKILYAAGFDPTGIPTFFRTMQRNRYSSNLEPFRYLITHPLDNARITEAQNRIDKLPPQPRKSSNDYYLMKARLKSLTHNDPRLLLESLEKDIKAKAKPTPADTYALVQALERAGNYTQARSMIQKLADAEPENIHYQLALARSLNKSGNAAQAVAVLRKMQSIYPDNFSVTYYYAETLKDIKRPKEGRDLLKAFLLKYPSPIMESHKLLAELYANSGDAINSKQTLAEYYFNTGNYNAAIFQLREALKEPNVDFVTRTQIEQRMQDMIAGTRS
jgi:predicted Zn-dependent protease